MKNFPKLHIACGLALFLAGCILRIFYMMFMPTFMIISGAVWVIYGLISTFAERGMRAAKWLRLACRIGLICIGVTFIIVQYIIFSNSSSTATGEEKYIIGLGAGLYGDVPSLAMEERMQALGEYMKQNPDVIAIVSGCKGDIETITEAEAYRRYLEGEGIAPERILIEDKSENTAQNMEFSARIIKEREGELGGISCAVLTNEFHLWRSLRLAKSAGLDATGIAVESKRFYLRLQYHIREYFSVVKMLMGLGSWGFSF